MSPLDDAPTSREGAPASRDVSFVGAAPTWETCGSKPLSLTDELCGVPSLLDNEGSTG